MNEEDPLDSSGNGRKTNIYLREGAARRQTDRVRETDRDRDRQREKDTLTLSPIVLS